MKQTTGWTILTIIVFLILSGLSLPVGMLVGWAVAAAFLAAIVSIAGLLIIAIRRILAGE